MEKRVCALCVAAATVLLSSIRSAEASTYTAVFGAAFAEGDSAKVDPLAGEPEGERIALWPEGKVPDREDHQYNDPFVEWFVPSNRTTDAAMIISCGGGYNKCGWYPDGNASAKFRDWLLKKGMTVVRLHYRTPRSRKGPYFRAAWQDAQRAVRVVRAGAEQHGVSPDRIGFFGCSAAGHQALLMAVSSQTAVYEPVDETDATPCCVNFAIAFYPAYVIKDEKAMQPNPEFAFDEATPPVLLVHGDADHHTPLASVRMYERLHAMKVPVELHVLATRGHSLMNDAKPGTPSAEWKETVWCWLVQLGFCR